MPPKVVQKSAAEFFADNKTIAGFDNPGKSLYTTIRELVENGLDAAEAINVLPSITVTIKEVTQHSLNDIIGLENHQRRDAALYQDFESEGQKAKRLAKEKARAQKVAAKRGEKLVGEGEAKDADGPFEPPTASAAAAGKAKGKANSKRATGSKGSKETTYYTVTCRDNGMGMPHDDIPSMLGIVLSGTKYAVKQTRGKFGLGAKMALIWSKMSTGLPIEIYTAQPGTAQQLSYCKLDIDIQKNKPVVHVHEKRPNEAQWHGAELSVTVEGNWTVYRSKILKYFREMAIITPYAEFNFSFESDSPDRSVKATFHRRTDIMPPVPTAAKHHPSALDKLLIKKLIGDSRQNHLIGFLTKELSSIDRALANRLIEEMGDGFDPKMSIKDLTDQQIARMHQLFREAKFKDITGEHLSPATEYNLRLGVMKELQPDLVATYQGSVGVYEGHPFIVEAAVSMGGKDVKPGITVYRFANRIPLLFEGGSDVCTRTATKKIDWTRYKINQSQDKIGVFVSIVSTKIPFKGTGKEYIGDDVEELAKAVKHAINQCCVQLKMKITRAQAAREAQQRKRNLSKYVPHASRAVFGALDDMVQAQRSKKTKLDYATDSDIGQMLEGVKKKEITEAVIHRKLVSFIERIDTELALEYATQTGRSQGDKMDVHLARSTFDLDRMTAPVKTDVAIMSFFRQACVKVE